MRGGAEAGCRVRRRPSLKGQQSDAPRDALCSVGEASNVGGNGPWNWTCNGANGGSSVSCEAPVSVGGSCGAANGVAASSAPTDSLCAQGKPSRVTGTGPWSWNCLGEQGGDTEGCTAPRTSAAAAAAPAPAASTPVASSGKKSRSKAAAAAKD